MFRIGAMVIAIAVLLVAVVVGIFAGTQELESDSARERKNADERTVATFYETLGALDHGWAQERLANLLAPDFTEQRPDIQQTLSREAFILAAIQEARTYPDRRLVPATISGDSGWVVTMVQTVDATPGRFGSIPLLESGIVRRELLTVRSGRIARLTVLDGTGSLLRSLTPVAINLGTFESQTIKIARRDYDSHASEQLMLSGDALLIADLGQLSISTPGENVSLQEGSSVRLVAGSEVTITNDSDISARAFMLFTASIQVPTMAADANRTQEPAPGVVVSVVGQSQPFLPEVHCLVVWPGHADLAAGLRLPSHRTTGYELLVPTSGEVEASNQHRDFLRTDAVRQWQDELPFARIAPGAAVAAPPDSWTTYSASGQEPARFWVFTIESGSNCSSSSSS